MKYLNYSDVALVPRHSSLSSRADADVSVEFLGHKFALPIVPANMRDVIDVDIAKLLCKTNHFYIMHRWFYGTENTEANIQCVKDFIQEMNEKNLMTSISIGVNNDWQCLILWIKTNGYKVDFITVDVAHSDHDNVKDIIKEVKQSLPSTKLIVGNVATAEGCEYLIKLGVDVVKIGCGTGGICTTKNKTGFTVPMFSCCLQCAPVCEKYNIPFIADGGIKEFGDIAKALTSGCSIAMAGGIFAECIDSPAEIINGHKQYRGSTSFEMKGINKHIEGKKIEIAHSVKYLERLQAIKEALQSSVSYAGGNNLDAFNLVNYIIL